MHGKYISAKKTRKWSIVWMVLLVLAISIGAGGVFAKYRAQEIRRAEMIAAGFYVSSDYLTDETNIVGGAKAEYTIPTRDAFKINLYNYQKENVSLISQTDIEYSVKIEGGSCDKTLGTTYKISTSEERVSEPLTITPTADKVTVTVTTAPYNYILSATFRVEDLAEAQMETPVDMGEYWLVTIHTGQREKLTLTWTDGLLPDNTNELMRTWNASSASATFDVDPFSTYELIFFDPQKVGGGGFQLN